MKAAAAFFLISYKFYFLFSNFITTHFQKIQESIEQLLVAFGENPMRQGLRNTPERVTRMYQELLSGYREDPIEMVNDAVFEVTYDEMVIVRDIEFYSLCEHHMLPFMCRAHVAYLPN